MEKNCQNCGQVTAGNYCSHCGQNLELKRIDKKYVFQQLLKSAGLEKGFIFTCKELLTKPGKTIQEYLSKNRQKVTKPITFLVLTSLIYTLILHYLKTDIDYSEISKKTYGDSSVFNIMTWIQNNYGYANLLTIIPITLWIKLFFRKHKYNFYEIFVLISFVMGMGMLIFSLEPLLNKISPKTFFINEMIIIFITFGYISWAIGQFYGKKIKDYLKAFLAYLFGTLTFQIIAIGIGLIYDWIIKN